MASADITDQMIAELRASFSECGDAPDTPIKVSILDLVTKGSENCTLVALTNISAVCADPTIEPTLLAKKAGGLDFRSLYKKTTRPVLVTLAATLSVAWSPSADPFVSNPFREDQIDDAWVVRRNNKLAGASDLRVILEHVSENRDQAKDVLRALASALIAKLGQAQVNYNLPPRLTTSFVSSLLEAWLDAASSKGARLEHVAISLLRFAGRRLVEGWDDVESHHVNDPRPHDAICRRKGKPLAIAECKDQAVTADHVNQLAAEMADHGATRGYLFTRKCWLDTSCMDQIASAIQAKSVFGYRIDVVEIMEATRTWLSLIDQDDAALPAFMTTLTAEMDIHGHLQDRRDLAALIDKMISGA